MAPIFIKDFKWYQSEDKVTVLLPLNITDRKNVDIFTCSRYVKVNSPPFIFELFLYSEINEDKSKCSCAKNQIEFELFKVEPIMWPNLTAEVSKEEMIATRKKFIDQRHERVAEQSKALRQKKYDLGQFAIQKQIGIGGSQQQAIVTIKNAERDKVSRELEDWKKRKPPDKMNRCEKMLGDTKESAVEISPMLEEVEKKGKNIALGRKHFTETQTFPRHESTTGPNNFPIPLPRPKGRIEVQFSERHFPTPTRESKLEEEQEWLRKQYQARKAAGFVAEDLRPEECDPIWLRDKGNAFYSHNNFLGAISAYSHAINIGSKMPELYSNRAAAHFQLGNFHKSLEDCSTALELLTPHVTANEDARFTCHVRRAAVFCKLGLPEKALMDYKEAQKLRPHDEELMADYNKATNMVAEEADSD